MFGIIRVAFYLFLAVAVSCGAVGVRDIPNPMKTPGLCGREGVLHSAICDIDNLISKDGKDVIEGLMNNISADVAEYGVAIISQMNVGMFSSVEESAKTYATTLHDEWGVGDKELQNGILIFVSVDDRITYISRGQGLDSKLTDATLDAVIDHMRKYLRQGLYGKAIESAILETKAIASGDAQIVASSSQGSHWTMILFGGFYVSLILFVLGREYLDKQKIAAFLKGQSALQRLTREVNNLEDEKYTCTSCPICLEEFPADGSGSAAPEGTEEKPMLHKNRPVALNCGHIMCHSCVGQYFKGPDGSKCPICRAPVDGSGALPGRSASTGSETFCTPLPSSWRSSRRRCHNSDFMSNVEILYRINRMRHLYPSVMTSDLQYTMTRAVESGSRADFLAAASDREAQVGATIADMNMRRAAASSGKGGSSRSSFGGGRSSGGRCGRW